MKESEITLPHALLENRIAPGFGNDEIYKLCDNEGYKKAGMASIFQNLATPKSLK